MMKRMGKFVVAITVASLATAVSVGQEDKALAQQDQNSNYLVGKWEVRHSSLGHIFVFTQDGRYSYTRYLIPSPGASPTQIGQETGHYETEGNKLTLYASDGSTYVSGWRPAGSAPTLTPGQRGVYIMVNGVWDFFYSR